MSTTPIPFMLDQRESLRGSVMASILLHVLLVVIIFTYGLLGGFGAGWGKIGASGGDAVHVGAVAQLPGIPLPAPLTQTRNAVAVQNPGLYQSEPVPQPPTSPDIEKIPKFKEEIKPEKLTHANPRIQPKKFMPPPNAVPYGEHGTPAMTYSPVVNSVGQGGISIGGIDFGQRFGWYVQAVRQRISNNWLLSTISPSILSAPRVYVDFDIMRDGTVSNVTVVQSSGIPEVDRSAQRAVMASSPLAPLPQAYSGSSVHVEFYFDFHR
jgi:periplasmic protein TonB